MATRRTPRSRRAANVAWRSIGPGVVREPAADGTGAPLPSKHPSVPMLPVSPDRLSRCRASAVVVVLPLVPVIPSSVSAAAGWPYQARASAIAALRPSRTMICGSGTFAGSSRTRAAAPRAAASATNRCPSLWLPRTAMKSVPS